MTHVNRRTFIKGTFAASVIGVAAGAGLLKPSRVLAAGWPKVAFDAKSVDAALKDLYGAAGATESKDIKVKAPLQAENGAVVPFQVATSLPKVEAIAVLVEGNATPLIANTRMLNAGGFFSGRMKMAKSSAVQAVVKSNGKLYFAKFNVKVTVGGCGG